MNISSLGSIPVLAFLVMALVTCNGPVVNNKKGSANLEELVKNIEALKAYLILLLQKIKKSSAYVAEHKKYIEENSDERNK